MSKAEFGKDVKETADFMEALAIDGNTPPGNLAMSILSQGESRPVVKRAALMLRTRELINQNRSKPRIP